MPGKKGKKRQAPSPRKKRQRQRSMASGSRPRAAAAAADDEIKTHRMMSGEAAYTFLHEQALGMAAGHTIRRNGLMRLLISGDDVNREDLLMQLLACQELSRLANHRELVAVVTRLPTALAAALVKQRTSHTVVKKEKGAGRRGAQANGQGGGGESADSEEEKLKTTPFRSAVHENQFVRLTRRYFCSPYFNKEDFYLTPEDFLKRLTEKNGGQVFGTHASNSRVYYNVFTCIRPSNSRV